MNQHTNDFLPTGLGGVAHAAKFSTKNRTSPQKINYKKGRTNFFNQKPSKSKFKIDFLFLANKLDSTDSKHFIKKKNLPPYQTPTQPSKNDQNKTHLHNHQHRGLLLQKFRPIQIPKLSPHHFLLFPTHPRKPQQATPNLPPNPPPNPQLRSILHRNPFDPHIQQPIPGPIPAPPQHRGPRHNRRRPLRPRPKICPERAPKLRHKVRKYNYYGNAP